MPRTCLIVALLAQLVASLAGGQVDWTGIDFVTVGSPNNPAYNRDDPQGLITGRGSTSYEFRMGRYEVTTGQWMEFYNTFKARSDSVPDSVLPPPSIWGAQVDPNYTGPGTRYRLIPGNPDSGMRFTAGITWRTAARFCNWLCNGKSSSLSALDNGAYDTSTFYDAGGRFDQLQHNPAAAYFIPSLDQWAKASFYDPRANSGQGGWWLSQYGRDRQPVTAPPPSWGGNGETNTGFRLPGNTQLQIPLGAYAEVGSISPWGLLDSAGATTEWTEERLVDQFGVTFRYTGGSSSVGGEPDWAYGYGADDSVNRYPWDGLRVAATVPAPGPIVLTLCALCWGAAYRQGRKHRCAGFSPSP
jgi:formylglycine-generating enzyme required for sulfatase activity